MATLLVLLASWWPAATARGDQPPAEPAGKAAGHADSSSAGADAGRSCPVLTRVRFYPRKGFAQRMLRGSFSGSNESTTADFEGIVQIKEVPPEGQWTEIQLAKPVRYRYLRYDSPLGAWGNVAEVEFYSGRKKLLGRPFGTPGSRDQSGNDFTKAMDGNVETFFDAAVGSGQYVGIDLGPDVQAAVPKFSLESGDYAAPQEITITSATPGAKIRFVRDWGIPRRDWGPLYKGPIRLEKSGYLVAVAYTDELAASAPVIAAYRIGPLLHDAQTVRTCHIGNSLTATICGVLQPLAQSAGRNLDFHSFIIAGAPTDWLWAHPGGSHYPEAFFALAPIDHVFTQPFHGHDRSIPNETDYSTRFFDRCRKESPGVQAWVYIQWPGPAFQDRWSQGLGNTAGLHLRPATTWQEAVANHTAYTEAVAERINKTCQGKPVRIVPGGPALAVLKTEMDAGRVPGMKDFAAEMFQDRIHLTPKNV
jgi:hypothetical protein